MSAKIHMVLPNIQSKSTNKMRNTIRIFPSCEYTLQFDGCSKGNPGPSGLGAVLYKNGEEIWGTCKYLGDQRTNNEAEYCALIFGLEYLVNNNIKNVSICGDSLLVINQINDIYKVKNTKLIPLYQKVIELKAYFDYIDFNHVYREHNKRADELANLAMNIVSLEDDIPEDLDKEVTIKKNSKSFSLPDI